jgi:hypothetical protein
MKLQMPRDFVAVDLVSDTGAEDLETPHSRQRGPHAQECRYAHCRLVLG